MPLRRAPMPTEVRATSPGCQAFLRGRKREAIQHLETHEAHDGEGGDSKKGLSGTMPMQFIAAIGYSGNRRPDGALEDTDPLAVVANHCIDIRLQPLTLLHRPPTDLIAGVDDEVFKQGAQRPGRQPCLEW
ncbi:hypothetical protein DM872_26610 [Pseudomonas taiwanensis]|nr:hypothetical protein [Pseudomonas taiwanensis]